LRTIRFAVLLVFLLVASLILVRTLGHRPEHERAHERLARLVGRTPATLNIDKLKNASAEDLYQLGEEYLQVWHVRDATLLFERAVAADSTRHDAWLRLIECYANPTVDNERGVVRAARRAQATSPTPVDTMLVSGLKSLFIDQDYAGAINTLSTLTRAKTPSADAQFYLALAYYRLGRLDDASKHLEPLLKQDATVGRVVELSIRRYAAAGQLDRAAHEASELAALYPEEPVPLVLLAQVELARENAAAALESADHALELDPHCVPAILTRSCLYAQAGDFESARVSYEKLMLFDDPVLASTGHEGIAFADFLAGDFDDGVDSMDEAIREAMTAGDHRRGLSLSSHLVDALCQLGRADAAEGVVERWITDFGDTPVRIARARIQLAHGSFDAANDVLTHLASEKDWVLWSRRLSIDITELGVLADIAQEKQPEALTRLANDGKERAAVGAGALERRKFLTAYAAFQTGQAEQAIGAFADVRRAMYGLEFPYHGDPVLFVQSYFYRAEAQLAAGQHDAARDNYAAFIRYWGDAAWDLDAIKRARQKVEALGGAGAPAQGHK
jgi:tetratricopeptide (TPR) repeat protein